MDKEERKKNRDDFYKTIKENAEKWISGDKPEPVDTSFSSVMLPMIKKVMPQTIASQIVGVQPMTFPSGTIFGTRSSIWDTIVTTFIEQVEIDGDNIDYYAVKVPYGYFSKHNVENDDIHNWCTETFSKEIDENRWYMRGSTVYLFKTEEDRNWFLLRWSS